MSNSKQFRLPANLFVSLEKKNTTELGAELRALQHYRIRWRYSEQNGGELWIDDERVGAVDYAGLLDTSRAPKTAVGMNKKPAQGSARYHTVLDGVVSNIHTDETRRIEEIPFSAH